MPFHPSLPGPAPTPATCQPCEPARLRHPPPHTPHTITHRHTPPHTTTHTTTHHHTHHLTHPTTSLTPLQIHDKAPRMLAVDLLFWKDHTGAAAVNQDYWLYVSAGRVVEGGCRYQPKLTAPNAIERGAERGLCVDKGVARDNTVVPRGADAAGRCVDLGLSFHAM